MADQQSTYQRERILRIAEVAQIAGVSKSLVRQWEQHGLIRPARSRGRYRQFDAKTVERVLDIVRLRKMQGLGIDAIKVVLAEHDAPAKPFGERLLEHRLKAGLSLRDVARRTKLSYSFISTVERSSSGASMASLKKLAQCYGTSVTAILSDEFERPKKNRIVRVGTVRPTQLLGPKVHVERLTDFPVKIDCERWHLAPWARSGTAYAHEGEELIYVLSGVFEITIEGVGIQKLQAADSIHFESTRRHSWRNPTNREVLILWVNSNPMF